MKDGAAPLQKEHGGIFHIVRALAVLLALMTITSAVWSAWACLTQPSHTGTLGATLSPAPPGPEMYSVTSLAAGSPLRSAGVREGDRLAPDIPLQGRFIDERDTIRFILVSRTPPVRISVVPSPSPSPPQMQNMLAFDSATSAFSCLLGGLLILRARRSYAVLALGVAFAAFSFAPFMPWTHRIDVEHWIKFIMFFLQGPVSCTAYLAFGLCLFQETTGKRMRWNLPLLTLAAALITLAYVPRLYAYATGYVLLGNAARQWLETIVFYGALFGTVGLLYAGWRRSRRDVQSRYALMLAGITLVILCNLFFEMQNILNVRFGLDNAFWTAIMEVVSASGHALFTYAVLRYRVVDFGFVVNRAVVYGVISALLLVAFGITEWAVEHFFPLESREKSALIDAAIALTIYLVFHRIKDSVERAIETMLFHKWHANEAALRRFIREASYISHPAKLLGAFAGELGRFTGGAGGAIYLTDETGRLANRISTLPGAPDTSELDVDDPAMVALRARHTSVEPDRLGSALPAALVLPMTHRGELSGIVLLGAKPDGTSYRPDETEVLAWAAQQIGLDHHALEVENVRRDAATLREQNAALNAVLDRALGARAAT